MPADLMEFSRDVRHVLIGWRQRNGDIVRELLTAHMEGYNNTATRLQGSCGEIIGRELQGTAKINPTSRQTSAVSTLRVRYVSRNRLHHARPAKLNILLEGNVALCQRRRSA